MHRTRRAFTLIDVCIVATIVTLLVVVGSPVLSSARTSARIAHSLSQMRQIQVALTLYRDQYDGTGMYGFAKTMGIPSAQIVYTSTADRLEALLPKTEGLWRSPCGEHPDAPGGSVSTRLGWLPNDFEDEPWATYARTMREQAVFLTDSNCNDHSERLYDLSLHYVTLGMTLDGTARRKPSTGLTVGALVFLEEMNGRQ